MHIKMTEFIYILTDILLPIVILISIGFVFHKVFKIDIKTFSKVVIYVLTPAVIFIKIYNIQVTFSFIATVMLLAAVFQVVLFAIGEFIPWILKYPKSMRKAFNNSVALFNSGNFGIPLIELVFKGSPVAMASQLFIMLIQNIVSSTIGVFQASAGSSSGRKALGNMLKMPSIYIIPAVILVRLFSIEMPRFIIVPLSYISDAYIGIALMTLGAHLADISWNSKINRVFLVSFTRLIVSPAIAFILVTLMGVKGLLAQAFIIGVSTPSAVTSVILANEFDNELEYTTQSVFVSTVLSAITLPLVIYLSMKYL